MTGVAGVAAVSQQDEHILDAVYYDTEDLRLIRAGVTLRRRTGGEDAGWHLKLPTGAGTRDEIRLPLAATAAKPAARKAARTAPGTAARTAGKPAARPRGKAAGAVPEELAALVRARTRGAVLAYVRQQALAISRLDPLVRRDEPDAVHQMRVATRRARTVLQAFGEIVQRERTRPLCDELKWLAAMLGQARDAEVLLARLTGELAEIPAEL